MGTSEAVRSLTSIENTSVGCWDARLGSGRGNRWLFAGGLLVGTPEEPSLSRMVTEEDIQFYVQQFKKSGFRYTQWCPGHRREMISKEGLLHSWGEAHSPPPWLP